MNQITVLMPVYNGEKYVAQAIESILSQSFKKFEFLIIDDGSTDSSREIVLSFQDKRIRFLTNSSRLKLSGALNRGISEAKTEFIARMDSDDIAVPSRLEKQWRFMQENSTVGICGGWVKRFGAGVETLDKNPTESEFIKAYTLFECPFSHPTVMMRKNLFSRHGLSYNGDYYPTEDYELWSRAVDCFPCANLDAVLLNYRVHGASMTGAEWSDMDAKGEMIAGRLLHKLEIRHSAEELRFHRNLGRGGSFKIAGLADIDRARQWLDFIVKKNKEVRRYQTESLQKTVELVWFRLCFNSTSHGLPVLTKYRSMKTLQGSLDYKKRTILILLSIFKNSLFFKG